MTENKSKLTMPREERIVQDDHHHLICWKSALAGLFVTLTAFLLLSSLGAGVAGFTAENLINKEEGGSALATGAGLWLGISVVMSLFCGSYFAVRMGRFVTSRIGAANGILIASVFFVVMAMGAGHIVGGVAQGLGHAAETASDSASNIAGNPMAQDSINKSLLGTNLKSNPEDVMRGLGVRLLQGDMQSAKSYYAYQTGLAPAEVDSKVAQLKSDFDSAVKRAGEKAAHAVGDAGLLVFVVVLLGLIAAGVGGRMGSHRNFHMPFAKRRIETSSQSAGVLRNERGSVVPYVFGWLLGVPVSILFLIAILRSIF